MCDTKNTPLVPAFAKAKKHEPRSGFPKVFRWPVPAQQPHQATTVAVVGSLRTAAVRQDQMMPMPPNKGREFWRTGVARRRIAGGMHKCFHPRA